MKAKALQKNNYISISVKEYFEICPILDLLHCYPKREQRTAGGIQA